MNRNNATTPLSIRVFRKFDGNSGFLDTGKLRNLCYNLGRYLSDNDLAEALKILDGNGDGKISENEFK